MLCRFTFIEGAASAFHFLQDVGALRSPDKRFRACVVTVGVGTDGHDEFFQIADNATPEAISQIAKEAGCSIRMSKPDPP